MALRQNEDMRKISAWAAIALVPTAIAGIYGMDFDNMPELRWGYGYFIVLAVIVTVCVVLRTGCSDGRAGSSARRTPIPGAAGDAAADVTGPARRGPR